MVFKEFYISDKSGKSNCVIRSLCKILNEKYDKVFNDLCEVAKELIELYAKREKAKGP